MRRQNIYWLKDVIIGEMDFKNHYIKHYKNIRFYCRMRKIKPISGINIHNVFTNPSIYQLNKKRLGI